MTLENEQPEGEQPPEQDFAEFEAAAAAEPSDDQEDKPDEPPEANDEEKEHSRSRSPERRIAQMRWEKGEAERRAAAAEREVIDLRNKLGNRAPADAAEAPKKPDPNDEKYEFGIHDPLYAEDRERYLEELADWKVEAKLGERSKKAEAEAEKGAVNARIEDGYASIEAKGTEKYDDFDEKITAAVEARGGEPLHPMVSIGLAVSPAGADIAYKLATDPKASDRLEQLASTNPPAAAIAFGELEGEFTDNDDDLNPADPLDMARMVGRMRARIAGGGAKVAAIKPTNAPTNAPEPPQQRARGGGGQFTVGEDTTDFAAFERKANAAK